MSMMPYHIYVWDTAQHGTANSLEQAIAMSLDLLEQPSEVNPKFISFAKHVQNHFKTAEGSEKRYYLNFDNEVKEHKKAALSVELPNDAWQPVLMCMVDAASRLGLAICDPETRMAFMPPNVVLPANRIDAWEQLKRDVIQPRFPQTIKQFRAWIKPLLNDILVKNAFDTKGVEHTIFPDHVSYTKKIALGTQFIDIQYTSRYRGEFGISVGFGVSCELVDLICKKFNLPPYRIPSRRIDSHIFKLFDKAILPSSRSGRTHMEQYQHPNDVYEFLGHLETIIFPILALAQDAKSFDKLINGGIDNGVQSNIKEKVAAALMRSADRSVRLIVARLANNPDFEELVLKLKPQPTKFASYIDESIKARIIEEDSANATMWENIVKYLHEDIKTLEDWPDGFLTHLQNDILPNTKDFPTTKEQFRELLKIRIGELVSEYGFVPTRALVNSGRFIVSYCKTINMGQLTLTIVCEENNDNFIPEIFLNIKEDNMLAIPKANFLPDVRCWESGISLTYKPQNFYIYNWTTLDELLSPLKQSVLLWSDGIDDIRGIDALLNGGKVDAAAKDKFYGYLYDFYALIAARLANNPNFEELVVTLGTYDADTSHNWSEFNIDTLRESWPKLVKYLREEVKPLV